MLHRAWLPLSVQVADQLSLQGMIIMLAASCMSVAGRSTGLNPSLSGLVLTYALGIVSVMNWAVRMGTEVCYVALDV